MGRRRKQGSRVVLDSGGIRELPRDRIETILRGARAIFSEAGRTTLVKILAGSKAKDVRPEWRENPSYGAFWNLSQKEILQMVDWCLEEEYLGLIYPDGFALIVFEERGLAIDVELAAHEFLEQMGEQGFFWTKEQLLNEIPHRTMQRVLELMKEDGIENWESVLDDWFALGTKRMKDWIKAVRREVE